MLVTAITLSPSPHTWEVPSCRYLNHVSRFNNIGEHLLTYLSAIEKVDTPWFCFVDSDDALPSNFSNVLAKCTDTTKALSYTNEVVERFGKSVERRGEPWSEDLFCRSPMILHHLVVCRTEVAREAMRIIPRGDYAVEPLLFFQIAKLGGANFVDEIGYIWKPTPGGLSSQPSTVIAQIASVTWAYRNRTELNE